MREITRALRIVVNTMNESFYSFSAYLRGLFGERVHRISLDAGFNCPNLDGHLSTAGCAYCNNKGFSVYAQSAKPLTQQIEESIAYYKTKLKVNKFIAYFQSFSNTYAAKEVLKEKYDTIKKFPEIVGLCISTRPDCVDSEKLELIASYQEKYLVWVEYGLQTTHNRVLANVGRNHTYEDFLKALALTRAFNVNVGVHMILGLPSASVEDMLTDAERISYLDIQGIKFHALHVFKDTALERQYNDGKITLLNSRDYITILCDFLERLPKTWVILRLISTANPKYLVAPRWINDKTKIIEGIKEELEKRGTRQGSRYEGSPSHQDTSHR
ncbi:MAG: TIGR01212 family radical SAM protein [Candidatus Omnitrophica bacterium]|nr:TIGR01212 family radical SAM protein [Candidatus Omnitrophota bacterium]